MDLLDLSIYSDASIELGTALSNTCGMSYFVIPTIYKAENVQIKSMTWIWVFFPPRSETNSLGLTEDRTVSKDAIAMVEPFPCNIWTYRSSNWDFKYGTYQ